ncbi:MAG: hypothetical protein QXN37_00825 [Candidatus Anstonellaceae archaeon]
MSKIKIHTEGYAKRGEKLFLEIELNLPQPLKARKLEVTLNCIQIKKSKTMTEMHVFDRMEEKELGIPHQTHMRERTSIIEKVAYKQTKKLDGERLYESAKYSVDFDIPNNSLPTIKHFDAHGRKVGWFVVAKLDVPLALDIVAKKEIIVE